MKFNTLMDIGKHEVECNSNITRIFFEYKEMGYSSDRTEELEGKLSETYYGLKSQWGGDRNLVAMNSIMNRRIDVINSLEEEYILLKSGKLPNRIEKIEEEKEESIEIIVTEEKINFNLVEMMGFANGSGITRMITDKNLLKLKPYDNLTNEQLCLVLAEIEPNISAAKKRVFKSIKEEYCGK